MDDNFCNYSGTETLLIADDDKMILNLLSDLFCDNGYNVILAKDGEEAVKLYKEHLDKISLVLMDIVMPRKDGLTASAEILKHNPEAIIYVMSGYNPETVQPLSVESYIKKPFLPLEIMKKIRLRLDGNSCGYNLI